MGIILIVLFEQVERENIGFYCLVIMNIIILSFYKVYASTSVHLIPSRKKSKEVHSQQNLSSLGPLEWNGTAYLLVMRTSFLILQWIKMLLPICLLFP